MSKVSVNVNFTASKILAYLIFFASVYLSVALSDFTAFSIGIPVAAALVLGKQGERVMLAKYDKQDSQ